MRATGSCRVRRSKPGARGAWCARGRAGAAQARAPWVSTSETSEGAVYPAQHRQRRLDRRFRGRRNRWPAAGRRPFEKLPFRVSAPSPRPSLVTAEAGRVGARSKRDGPRADAGHCCRAGICGPVSRSLALCRRSRTCARIEVGDGSVDDELRGRRPISQQRTVHLNQARSARQTLAPSLLGHSIGRLGGRDARDRDDRLYTAHRLGIVQVPWTPSTRLVERLSLTADRQPARLYAFTVEDPGLPDGPQPRYTAKWDHRPEVVAVIRPSRAIRRTHARL